MPRLHRYRFGLRARLALTFALGALVLSTVLSLLAWGLTRENQLSQRVDAEVDGALHNAVTVSKTLPSENLQEVLSALSNREGAAALVHYGGRWQGQDT